MSKSIYSINSNSFWDIKAWKSCNLIRQEHFCIEPCSSKITWSICSFNRNAQNQLYTLISFWDIKGEGEGEGGGVVKTKLVKFICKVVYLRAQNADSENIQIHYVYVCKQWFIMLIIHSVHIDIWSTYWHLKLAL